MSAEAAPVERSDIPPACGSSRANCCPTRRAAVTALRTRRASCAARKASSGTRAAEECQAFRGRVTVVAPQARHLHDTRSAWLRHRQIESDGAILVRPDGSIAWRDATSAEDPRAVLADALRRILGRATDVAAAGAIGLILPAALGVGPILMPARRLG